MNIHHRGPKLAAILLLAAIILSACQQSVSNAPLATATLITPTGLFVTPLTGANPMEMIEEFAQGTAAAQTAAAGGGTPTTPQVVATTGIDLTAISTYTTGTAAIPTNNLVATATTPIVASTVISSTVISTPIAVGTVPTAGPKPATYTLQQGEWPYCIARRFNVNPDELLRLSGLTTAQSNMLLPGQLLTIPQGSSVFPSDRALKAHPATYTAVSGDTVYSIACKYGDVDPNALAAYNNISVASKLTAGTTINIP